MQKKTIVLAFTALLPAAFSSSALAADSLTEALTGGKVSADFRARYEAVDQDNALKDANALTARLRLGYLTGEYKAFSAFVEAEHLTALGGEEYNSTTNGQTGYSVVADPEFTEINQAYLSYSGIPDTALKYGRQRLVLDNHRFIGNVGWRQNEQTYDAFTVVNRSLAQTTVTAGYIYNVNRVFSDESPVGNFRMNSPIFNVKYDGWRAGTLVGYGYLLDFDNLPANSTRTFGLRFAGGTPFGGDLKALYTLEYASQSDYRGNPADFNLNYYLAEGGINTGRFTAKLGYELLSGNGSKAFQTPLATLHAMNGWADQFLATPADGLKDAYISASTDVAGIKLSGIYHDFRADTGNARYGTEWDLVATKAIGEHYSFGAKFAAYRAKDFSVDTDKLWLWTEAKF
ncbi:MAG: alginate export family protein [Gammaproteobacteria bacterium]|nr:alginate export family protein [Gammaproteobacteria bacterium]MBU2435549.1 alginate export family protein [Gammaproteobacteria bacterium]MBU2449671.1 alginate export family protein [Gammaproteobacteria bacterium]